MKTLIHLVRHGEVLNPLNIWYGRLEGFELSPRGMRQAEALGTFFGNREIQSVYSSPLTRALQTAGPIARECALQITHLDDVIECTTKLEGNRNGIRLFRNPLNVRFFLRPSVPSWGEPYREIAARMTAAVADLRSRHLGEETVVVSHMTPIMVARAAIEGNHTPAWRLKVECQTASVTTLCFEGDDFAGVEYQAVGATIA